MFLCVKFNTYIYFFQYIAFHIIAQL